ncbi:phosphotransferase family protein [Demequina pelophila]|uniref:phosphotransferase family protein n=1 Tax=Demequina pelophila TaxID=1638984 RepID=UPI00078177C7|nr:aminoglycoside phosphotransferase family protein [Demequina pelophila]
MTGPLPLFPTQSPLTRAELEELLAPLGAVAHVWPMEGGSFSSVQSVELHSGDAVVVKTSVSEDRLLTYERDLLRAERDHLRRLESVAGVPAPVVLIEDFSRDRFEVDVIAMTLLPGMAWVEATELMTAESNDRALTEVGGVLAALGTVAAPRFGFPAHGFALGGETWPAFMAALVEATAADAERWRVDAGADRLARALESVRPDLAEVTAPTLVHADLWHGNVLVDPSTGAVTGVVDFERSLYGDPLWGLAGGETHSSGPLAAAKVRGYEAATGLPLVMDAAARRRIALYRLWSMTVQEIELAPRGYSGDWLDGLLASIRANRERLCHILGV